MNNEVYNKLVEQATKVTEHFDENTYITITSSYFDRKLFAELIVKECCNMFVELRTRPADLAANDVKNYFGVE